MKSPFEFRFTVAPEDIDRQGHANNVAYLRWAQDAAVAHSASLGWTTERYASEQITWVVRSHHIRYRQPAIEGDEILILTWIDSVRVAASYRHYEIRRSVDRTLLASVETEWAFIDLATNRPARIPDEIRAAFGHAG